MNEHPGYNAQTTPPTELDLDEDSSWDRLWLISITLLVFSAILTVTSRTVVDADLWGHLRFGLDNIQAGTIIQTDPYSYLTAGVRWINHEWLAEVAFGLAWMAAGTTGLILLKTTIGISTLGIIFLYLRSLGAPVIRASVLVILGWIGILTAIATVRPHMFTLLFSTLTFLIIAKAEQGNYRWLWAAPVVMLLWINFHGGVLAGMGFLGIWAVVHLVIQRKQWRMIVPPVILSALALLINPYGLELVTFLLRTATVSRPEIIEWQPIDLVSLLGFIYLVFLVIMILGLIVSKIKKRVPILVLLCVAALLPFVAFRHLPLFALAILVLGGEYLLDAWSQINPPAPVHKTRPRKMSIVSLVIGLVLCVWSLPNFQRIVIPNQPEPFFPDRAVSLIVESGAAGNLAVEFNWGQYVLWHLGPEVQVSMDGRRETVYSEEIYQINQNFVNGTGDWDEVLDDYETHMALVYQTRASRNLMQYKEGWELLYEDPTSALFASPDWSGFTSLKDTISRAPEPPTKDYFP